MVKIINYDQKSWSSKTNVITFRLKKEEFIVITKLAIEKGVSPHEYVRQLVRAYLRAKGLIP